MTTTEKATRPIWSEWINHSRHSEVLYRRAVSAYDLAARISAEPSTDEVDAAAALLNSIQRYAIADAREWERDNDARYYDKPEHKAQEKRLNARRVKLEKRLAAYGCKLRNYGLYPEVIDSKTGDRLSFLHYFD